MCQRTNFLRHKKLTMGKTSLNKPDIFAYNNHASILRSLTVAPSMEYYVLTFRFEKIFMISLDKFCLSV